MRWGSWAFAAVLLAGALPAWSQTGKFDPRSMAPFVPTPQKVVERMLQLGEVKNTDTVYDLGAGDGRIVITAAKEFKAKAVGVELDQDLVKRIEAKIKELDLGERAKVVHGHLMDVDLKPASVVTLYLLSSSNLKLRPKLEKDLKPGSRVVSHDFQIMGWTPAKTEQIDHGTRTHTIFVYVVGKH